MGFSKAFFLAGCVSKSECFCLLTFTGYCSVLFGKRLVGCRWERQFVFNSLHFIRRNAMKASDLIKLFFGKFCSNFMTVTDFFSLLISFLSLFTGEGCRVSLYHVNSPSGPKDQLQLPRDFCVHGVRTASLRDNSTRLLVFGVRHFAVCDVSLQSPWGNFLRCALSILFNATVASNVIFFGDRKKIKGTIFV